MITSFPGHRDPGCPGFRCPQPVQVFLQTPSPSSSPGASRRTTSARIKSPSVGHLAVRSGLEPTQLINQSYIMILPKGHAHLNAIPYGSPRSATMRSVAANGADRAPRFARQLLFSLKPKGNCSVEETRGSRSRHTQAKEPKH